jgi:hypothetical protein
MLPDTGPALTRRRFLRIAAGGSVLIAAGGVLTCNHLAHAEASGLDADILV